MIYFVFSDFFCSGTYSEIRWRTISSLAPWSSNETVSYILPQLATHDTMHQTDNVSVCIPILKYGLFQIYFVLENIVELVVECFSFWFQYHKTLYYWRFCHVLIKCGIMHEIRKNIILYIPFCNRFLNDIYNIFIFLLF